MSKQVMKIVSDAMDALGIEYGFDVYKKKPVVYPYFVGEYTETEPMTEDGLQESTFMLTGFARGSNAWLTLEDAIEEIRNYFDTVNGKKVITDTGSGVAIFYASAMNVPQDDAELKSVQINLTIKEWKVK